MRVTPRGSTSTEVRIVIAETGAAFGNTKLRRYPFTSCKGNVQTSRPSSEYRPAKPRMPCAAMYLFGCAFVVDQRGRSGTRCESVAGAAEGEACAKLKLLKRRSIGTERSMEPPRTAKYPQIIPPDTRIAVRNLPTPPGLNCSKGPLACVDDSVQNKLVLMS